jgi:hypothetical protein
MAGFDALIRWMRWFGYFERRSIDFFDDALQKVEMLADLFVHGWMD